MAKSLPQLESLVLLLVCFCLGACVAIDNITITQPLHDSQTIVSSGQTFKLGFFSPVNSSKRYVGIMFNMPMMTVVWVANRDKPLNDSGGSMTISEDGNLVILNDQKEIVWSSSVSNRVANCSAQLLDTGDLVLRDNSNGRIIWESFQNPTDSFVQRMRISAANGNQKRLLTSWRSPSDPSIGDFSAGFGSMPVPQFFIWNSNRAHWRSGPWNGNVFLGVPGMKSAYQNRGQMVDDGSPESPYYTFTFNVDSVTLYYQLTSTGFWLEKYWEPGQQDWKVCWSSMLSQCDVYGKCGPFGICNPLDSTICKCLQGFESRDKEEWGRGNFSGGCIRRTLPQCGRNNSANQNGKRDGYVKLTRIKPPDLAEWHSSFEQDCDSVCLSNCSCIAYAYYKGIGCVHWSGSLIDIQQYSFDGADLYVRVAYSELDNRRDMDADNRRDMKVIIGSTVVVGCLLVAASAYFSWMRLSKHGGKQREDEASLFQGRENMPTDNLEQGTLEDLTLLSYETLANATNNFHSFSKLGKGGFGQVYKGELSHGLEIAVKRLSKSSCQGIEEFMNEVVVISKLQHRNLVRLLGCCVEREEKMLVYEYMPKGSLDGYLFDSQKQGLLDWSKRALIIEGIGRGLQYLHRDSRLRIIHRDLKASNILLDKELNPKISDFGLARIFEGNQDQARTRRVVGTYGYMPPEYAMDGRFSEKSDVYSFGVLLLEIVSGRRCSCSSQDEDELSLVGYAWKLWNENQAVNLVDPAIYHAQYEKEAWRYIHVGLLCVQESAKDRPNVSAVLSMLNSEIAELPPPKLPAFTPKLGSPGSEPLQQSAHSVNDYTITTVEPR